MDIMIKSVGSKANFEYEWLKIINDKDEMMERCSKQICEEYSFFYKRNIKNEELYICTIDKNRLDSWNRPITNSVYICGEKTKVSIISQLRDYYILNKNEFINFFNNLFNNFDNDYGFIFNIESFLEVNYIYPKLSQSKIKCPVGIDKLDRLCMSSVVTYLNSNLTNCFVVEADYIDDKEISENMIVLSDNSSNISKQIKSFKAKKKLEKTAKILTIAAATIVFVKTIVALKGEKNE